MKKLKNIALFAVMFVVLFSFAGSAKALDIVDDGVMLDSNNEPFIKDATNPDKYAWQKLKTTDGTIVYCADVERHWPDSTDSITYNDTIDSMDPGLIYLLQQAGANPSDQQRYVIQGAIWLYRASEGSSVIARFPGEYEDPYNLVPQMESLARAAKNAKASDVSSATIANVSSYNGKVILLNDEKQYFISALIPSLVSGVSNYTVSVSGVNGAVLVPGSGTGSAAASLTLNSDEGFYVRVPFANGQNYNKEVTVTISIETNAQFISPVGTVEYQRVIGLFGSTKPVTKSFTLKTDVERVCVDYVIVGDVKPDPALTDPTPEKKCYEKGINYNQEKELTTRTRCVFKGWNTSSDLTGKWVDGTALNNDMTLYGAWDCPSTVIVPPTAAQAPFIALGIGLIGAAGVLGYYTYNKKH